MARLKAIEQISVSSAGKYNKYARLLNELQAKSNRLQLLLDRPEVVVEDVPPLGHPFFLALEEMKHYVDIQLDIYNTSRKRSYKEVSKAMRLLPKISEIFERFEIKERVVVKSLLSTYMSELVRKTRKREFIVRNLLEVSEAYEKGWYMVFQTLTIDPKKAFDQGMEVEEYLFRGRKIELYLKKLQNGVLLSMYPKKSLRQIRKEVDKEELKVQNYFRYSIVFEPHKNGRPHAHMLLFMKKLPVGVLTVDPNKNYNEKTRRQVVGFAKYWQHGFSMPIAVRFNKTDAYSKLGWSWPTDEDGVALKANSPKAIAFYLAKYIAKESSKWKIRTSQLFGITPLVRRMEKMDMKELLMCLTWKKLSVTLFGTVIPRSLLRQSATRLLVKKYVTFKMIFDRVVTWRCLMSRPWLSKSSITMMEMFSKLNSSDTLTESLTGTDISRRVQCYMIER